MPKNRSKSPPAAPSTWLAPKRAAEIIGISTYTVLRMMRQGKIPHRCVPGMRRRWVEADVVERMNRDSLKPATAPV
jgi:predicted site-specific integrase-resolvase